MKIFLQIFMAFLLSFSLLAPALMTLATGEVYIILYQSAEEENDNQSNNLLEEIKEKKLTITNTAFGDIVEFNSPRVDFFYYSASTIDLAESIFLPPPEKA